MSTDKKKEVNNLLVVDPNPCGGEKIEIEDLSITVELEVFSRDNEILLFSDDTVTSKTNSNRSTRVSFIDSSKDGDNKTNLTTKYTELNTTFNDDSENLEGLGIESIDINFNTSYAPMIKIKFKDIRGRLFEMGNDSPYGFLFELPYPIFYLTIKGYYGKPVRFAIHLLKFNSTFDNDTGSFIIDCDFIGYTYAFLTDMLMGYLKAIPFTIQGQKLIRENEGFLTFEDLKSKVKRLTEVVEKYKNDDKKLKALLIFTELKDRLNSIKGLLQESTNNFVKTTELKAITFKVDTIRDNKSLDIAIGTVPMNNNTDISFYNTVVQSIEEYNEFSNSETYKLNISDFRIDTDSSPIYYPNLTILDFTVGDWETNKNKMPKNKQMDKNKYDVFGEILRSSEAVNTHKGVTKINIYDFKSAIDKIDELLLKIANDSVNIKNNVLIEFIGKIEEGFTSEEDIFDPSIGNIFKILTDHVEIFLKSILAVAREAERDNLNSKSGRKSKLSRHETSIKPFPDFKGKNSEDFFEDKWIGTIAPDLAEVIFINDLYDSIIKADAEDRKFLENVNVDKNWYPINPLDTKIFNSAMENPWDIVGNELKHVIYKVLTQRMVTFLGYSNKNLTNVEINDMAKIEAQQSFNSIKNNTVKLSIIDKSVNPAIIEGKIDEIINSNIENFNMDLIDVGNNYKYTHGDDDTTFLLISQTLGDLKNPLNTIFSNTAEDRLSSNIVYGSNLISDDFGEIFIKILNSAEYENPETYVDYTSTGTDTISNYKKPEKITGNLNDDTRMSNVNYIFGGEYKTPEFTLFKDEKNKIFVEFYSVGNEDVKIYRPDASETKYDTFRFNKETNEYYFNSGFEAIPIGGVTVDNDINYDLGKLQKILIADLTASNLESTFNFNSTFNSQYKTYSLFGSDLYYEQEDNYAKAFLFLHTIPFEGMGIDNATKNTNNNKNVGLLNSKVVNFFNKRAGFVDVPYSWILFMGGLLYRANGGITLRFDNTQIGSLIPNFDSSNNLPSIDDYLNSQTISIINGQRTLYKEPNLNFFDESGNSMLYSHVSQIILNLPQSVKDIFIDEFKSWVQGDYGFKQIQGELEIFSGETQNDRYSAWKSLLDNTQTLPFQILSTAKDNYSIVSPSKEYKDKKTLGIALESTDFTEFSNVIKEEGTGSPINFNLQLNDDADGVTGKLRDFLKDTRIIANTTYRIWEEDSADFNDILLSKANVTSYLTSYFNEFKDLNYKIQPKSSDDVNKRLFNTIRIDDVKLSIYKNIKSIYDKWVVGVDSNTDGVLGDNLSSSFKFVDRAHRDISTAFKISPVKLVEQLTSNNNANFYSFIARILKDNNFDFIPLPTYINYTDIQEVSDIFKPNRFNETVAQSGPTFVCMYIGERSNKLDLTNKEKENINDSFRLETSTQNCVFSIDDTSQLPNDFSPSNPNKIPYFLVKYADQNQSLFKSIKLNQSEFTETQESLQIIDDLSRTNEYGSIGQNLFDIYNNRAYSAEIEMLGCAQVQPFMYFQLDDIPMFRGAYTIINTSHKIKPNHMTTTFKGVRVRKVRTKMIDKETLYLSLIGDMSKITRDDTGLSDLTGVSKFDLTPTSSEESDIDNANLVDSKEIKDLNFGSPLDRSDIVVTSEFGIRDIGYRDFHNGLDFRAEVGTPVISIGDGEVTRLRFQGKGVGGGLYMEVKYTRSGNVDSGFWYARYMHLDSIDNKFFPTGKTLESYSDVDKWDIKSPNIKSPKVRKSDELGTSGGVKNSNYAGSSGAPHLHFDIRNNGSINRTTNDVMIYGKNPRKVLAMAVVEDEWTSTKVQNEETETKTNDTSG